MDAEDQKDIINKIKSSGNDTQDLTSDDDLGQDETPEDGSQNDGGFEEPANDEVSEIVLTEYINTKKLNPLKSKNHFNRSEVKMILDMIYNSVDISGQYRIMDVYKALGFPFGESKNGNLFIEPKKNNMFQDGSNDILDENNPCWKGYKQVGMKTKDGKEVPNCVPVKENLNLNEKNSIFDRLKNKIKESLNQDDMMTEPMVEPDVKPKTQPTTKPVTEPKRKDKPFLPMPNVQPNPKANKHE
jgi:hypothetical protein